MILRLAVASAGVIVLLYAALVVGMYTAQRSFLFRPDPARVPPDAVSLTGYAEVTLKTPDGEQLVAWHAVAEPGKKTLLYFHGNAGNIAGRRDRLEAYHNRFGFGVLILGYRGSSGSTGSVSEANYVADAKLSYDWLLARGVAAQDIVLYGESLGTGVAVRTAAENPVGGVILDAPYTAVVDIAAARYWFLPVRLLLSDQFRSLELMPRITAPLLVIHGALDPIIPVEMGRAIFAAANEPKQMIEYPQAGHIFHSQFGSLERIREFVNGLGR
jgi:uncharacterized protein